VLFIPQPSQLLLGIINLSNTLVRILPEVEGLSNQSQLRKWT